MNAVDIQKDIFTQGTTNVLPVVPVDADRLEKAALEKMTSLAAAYIAGGAGMGQSMRNNRLAFDRWQIVPRMLRDVSSRDLSVSLFGRRFASPLLLAPLGVLEMVHPAADLAVAEAAARMNVPYILSNQASVPMERVTGVMGDTLRWFQLYWSKSDELVASLVHRAEAAGCTAIVVTLDTTLLGWRTQDLDLAHLPFLRGKGIAQYSTDPVFQHLLNGSGEPAPVGQPALPPVRSLAAVKKFTEIYTNPALTWDKLSFLRQRTKLPILLKGILHPDDARLALEHGIDGLIVSNHGGRQVDGAIGALDALPAVVDAVGDQIPVLFDSGIRGGADLFKALALGARAVCLGRPYAYGLALAGADGVAEVLRNLLADFELTMALSGYRSVAELNRACLVRQVL